MSRAPKAKQPKAFADADTLVDSWVRSYHDAADMARGTHPDDSTARAARPIADVRRDFLEWVGKMRRFLDRAELAIGLPTIPGSDDVLEEVGRFGDGDADLDADGVLSSISIIATAIAARGKLSARERREIVARRELTDRVNGRGRS